MNEWKHTHTHTEQWVKRAKLCQQSLGKMWTHFRWGGGGVWEREHKSSQARDKQQAMPLQIALYCSTTQQLLSPCPLLSPLLLLWFSLCYWVHNKQQYNHKSSCFTAKATRLPPLYISFALTLSLSLTLSPSLSPFSSLTLLLLVCLSLAFKYLSVFEQQQQQQRQKEREKRGQWERER